MDAGVTPDADAGSGRAEVVKTGTANLVLRGLVLTPTGPLQGEVLIVGNTIACVAADCSSAESSTATIIETHGVISPGLVDAHNHIGYNFLGEWVRPTPILWGSRDEWRDDPDYERHVAPYSDNRNGIIECPAQKWAELRSLMHGTTTLEGQSFSRTCVSTMVRNADSQYHGLPNGPGGSAYSHLTTSTVSPRDLNTADALDYQTRFTATTRPLTRLAIHMAEGFAGNVLLEFDSFVGRDPRPNRHSGVSLLSGELNGAAYRGTGYLIHGCPLSDAQLLEARDAGAFIVWSPSSNLVLYGRTAPIQRMLQLGLTVGLGPDWTVSGSDELLSELRAAQQYGLDAGIPELTPQTLWTMATKNGALATDLANFIGTIEVGKRADLAVFGHSAIDPYQAVIDSRAADVRLVLIDGKAYYGDAALNVPEVTVNNACDAFDACGTAKFVCARNLPPLDGSGTVADTTQSIDDVAGALRAILMPYGRTDELLPLVDCSL